jgi:hypothetical protein
MPEGKRQAGGNIRRPILHGALAVAASAIAAAPATATADTFLRLGTIKGEAIEAKHKDQIDILSFTQSLISSADFSTASCSAARSR